MIMPQLLDQFYWARRVEALGLGVQVARYSKKPETLAQAMSFVLSGNTFASQAQRFADKMTLDGVSRGAHAIEVFVKR